PKETPPRGERGLRVVHPADEPHALRTWQCQVGAKPSRLAPFRTRAPFACLLVHVVRKATHRVERSQLTSGLRLGEPPTDGRRPADAELGGKRTPQAELNRAAGGRAGG